MEGLEKLKHTFPVTNWENWLGIFKWKEVQNLFCIRSHNCNPIFYSVSCVIIYNYRCIFITGLFQKLCIYTLPKHNIYNSIILYNVYMLSWCMLRHTSKEILDSVYLYGTFSVGETLYHSSQRVLWFLSYWNYLDVFSSRKVWGETSTTCTPGALYVMFLPLKTLYTNKQNQLSGMWFKILYLTLKAIVGLSDCSCCLLCYAFPYIS